MPDVNELCVLITGAGDSVGRVRAEKFFNAGAQVHICDVREDAVYFLATDTAPHVTGLLMEVSGGVEWEE